MKKGSKIIKCIIFFIIGIFIFQTLTYIFVPKWLNSNDPATARIKGFYLEKENTIDALVVGSSSIGRGYSPISVWDKYGITSYNLGTARQTTPIAYYKIKEALKYQSPRVIVLDVDSITNQAPTEESKRRLFDNMKLDEVKLEAINDINVGVEDKLSVILPLLRFHSRWNELEYNDFNKSLEKEYKKVSYKGEPIIDNVKSYTGKNNYMEDNGKITKISEVDLEYIDRIVKLCKENNIKLVWIEMPCAMSWNLANHKAILNLSQKYDIEFIDFNLMLEELNINWKTDTYDEGWHLNIDGAEKVSKYIGKVLSEKYNLPNRKNDKSVSKHWKKEAKRYKENKKELQNKRKDIKK